MAHRATVDYEVVLRIAGWRPGYARRIRRDIEAALEASGFGGGHLRFESIRELPAPVSLLQSDPARPAPTGPMKERK